VTHNRAALLTETHYDNFELPTMFLRSQ